MYGNQNQDDVALVMSWRDLSVIRGMLGDVPFKHADPICQALNDLATQQLISGLREIVSFVN